MEAAALLSDLRQTGIEPKVLDGNHLAVPAGVLSDDMRHAIRTHKLELIALLRHAANDPEDWRAVAARYYCHHFSCRQCIAAGHNPSLQRCDSGLKLWLTYITQHERQSTAVR